MTYFESDDSNALEIDGIHIEIWEPPNLIVLPIPENMPSTNTPMKIGMRIINNTSIPFRYQPDETIIPEIVASDGRVLPRQIATDDPVATTQPNIPLQLRFLSIFTHFISNLFNLHEHKDTKELDCWLIEPGVPCIVFLTARLLWQNNLFKLQIPTNPDYLFNPIIPKKFWSFDDLQPGAYQLRFIYDIDCGTRPDSNLDIREVRTVQQMGLRQLATPFVNFLLVQPASTDSEAIEVNGIQFKIEIPEPVLTIPPYFPGAKTSVKLGIRVINNTQTPIRFERLNSLTPILMEDDDKALEPDSDLMRLGVSKGLPYYLAMPRESVFFVLDGVLSRNFLNKLQLAIPNEASGFWYFRDLKVGRYKLQFIYQVAAPMPIGEPAAQAIENVWTGCIVTPFVELCLVKR
ncbi:MAG: hypothetical protein V7L04_18455 [Nostoc sp.]|uniref:hypothetical protein n=1 Tax=Nostoc sp. TaxID=1180 RepID=UPI002FF779CC